MTHRLTSIICPAAISLMTYVTYHTMGNHLPARLFLVSNSSR